MTIQLVKLQNLPQRTLENTGEIQGKTPQSARRQFFVRSILAYFDSAHTACKAQHARVTYSPSTALAKISCLHELRERGKKRGYLQGGRGGL